MMVGLVELCTSAEMEIEMGIAKKEQEQFHLSNRVDYTQKLPCAEEVIKEYLKWEQSKEGKEKEELYMYRKTGKMALTWGWYMEKLQEEKVEGIEWNVLKICSEKLKQYRDSNQDIYQKMLTTIVFILFVYPYKRNGGMLKNYQYKMLESVEIFLPWMLDDICGYPGIIYNMQFCRNIPLEFGMYCMKKWKASGDKEQDVGEFIRKGKFMRELFSVIENKHISFRKRLEFMEEYTAENREWQESYVFQLIRRIRDINILFEFAGEDSSTCIREQFKKLSQKGINLLETYFKYKNIEQSWDFRDIDKIRFFLQIQKDKNNTLSAEELDKFIELFDHDVRTHLVMLLDRCRIKIADKSKLHLFQIAVCLYTSEEEMVRFYRKKLLPKEILNELIINLRNGEQIEKIPLLLQWMYGEDD